MSHSVSIPNISEEDNGQQTIDDHVRRTRSKFRRIPNKLGHRHRTRSNRIFHRVVRKLRKWWKIPLFLLSIGLLVYEASTIWKRFKESPGSERNSVPTTRIVHGVREHKCCLKLSPPEYIKTLPSPFEKSASPVKEIVYITGVNSSFVGEKTTLLQQPFEVSRFNRFTGFQTFYERNESFKVNERAVVHCGFYSENGGFKVSDEDKSYMETCQIVVSTCTFGGGYDLYQPIGMSEETLRKVCYVAFWDEFTLKTQELEGIHLDNDHTIGKWRIVVVRELPFIDKRLNGKIPKMLGHRLFPRARYSIWVDSKSQLRRDPVAVLEALLWRTKSVLAISEHGARSSVYDEALAIVQKNKENTEEVDMQIAQYRMDGFSEVQRFSLIAALAQASVIVRDHAQLTNMFMCLWFNEVVHFTSHDQLSFPYVMWRMGMLKDINVYPVCTHRDLVNTMGHKRKEKPNADGDVQLSG
ncbi:hypothetical protein L6452_28218 [Arctium lappa]|uniref:Uncharacterized protein n=1 Tax=Arctium lappa TaxID=4217 RepID=A0ACB8ZYN6_ARCLA|nr:hypothetical protein L6452_28218 [Arctium lappa]